MKTKPAAKPKNQPTADTMTTTTQQAAEQNPAPTTEQAAEPTPGYAFSLYANTSPTLQEIAAITGLSFDEMKWPTLALSWRVKTKLDAAPKPRPTDDIAFIADRTAALKAQLRTAALPKDEALEIQRRILEITNAPFKPVRDHQEKIDRLSLAIDTELEAFEEWIKNDPAGVAASVADEAHTKWQQAESARQKAEQERRDSAAKEAERQARAEKLRRERQQEAEELADEIGAGLDDTDLDHPDLDGQRLKDFIDWQSENDQLWHSDQRPLNAILTGPPGVGKSRALAAVALAECEEWGRENVEWITGYEFAELVSNLSTDKRDESTARLQAITETTTLYFDDLGSANFTTARTSRFFRLIDERYRRKLPTFFSTNYSTAQLKKLFTATSDSKDEAVRILRRIIGTPSEPLAKFFHFQRPQK